MRRRCAAVVGVVIGAIGLGGCTSLPAPATTAVASTAVDAPFSIGGRISARRGVAGIAGNFRWVLVARRDAIDGATPLGQTLARLEGDARGINVTLQDGRTETAATWAELTERALGVTIPVDGLASWVRAAPRAGQRFTVERDARGRVAVLSQDGWDVSYAYASDDSQRPFRINLSFPGADPVDVRVVVDRWQ
jgi:outer membrane lipoprotein LolB